MIIIGLTGRNAGGKNTAGQAGRVVLVETWVDELKARVPG